MITADDVAGKAKGRIKPINGVNGKHRAPQTVRSAEMAAIENRLQELETDQAAARQVIATQQIAIRKLLENEGANLDPRSTMLFGALWNLANDPFNSGAWDKFRQFLRAIQAVHQVGKVEDGTTGH